MVRGKVEIKRIENATRRQVTFSKRRGGFFKKANELSILTDCEVAAIVFSSSGKLYQYCSPWTSMAGIIDKYQRMNNLPLLGEHDHRQQMVSELTRMKQEIETLESNIRRYLGEDVSLQMTVEGLELLERQLEVAAEKIRNRMHDLINQQIENLRRKGELLDNQNCKLSHLIQEQQAEIEDYTPHYFIGESSSSHQQQQQDEQQLQQFFRLQLW